jgi:hypothetical protein
MLGPLTFDPPHVVERGHEVLGVDAHLHHHLALAEVRLPVRIRLRTLALPRQQSFLTTVPTLMKQSSRLMSQAAMFLALGL